MIMTRSSYETYVRSKHLQLFHYTLSIVADRALAQDILQDVLVRLWEKRSEMDHIHNQDAWCMRCLKNRALDVLRSKSHGHGDLDSHPERPAHRSLQQQVEHDDMITQLQSSMAQLTTKQQEVIRRKEFLQYTNTEIAQEMKLTDSDVKVTIHRARLRLRELLQKKLAYGL